MRRIFPIPIVVMLITGLLFVLVAAIVWHNWDPLKERDMAARAALNTPSSIDSLLRENAKAMPGDMVYLNDVVLSAGPNKDLFVVSGAMDSRMLVVFDLPNSLVQRTPVTVDIKGLIRRLPSPAMLRKDWKLNKEQVRAFAGQEIYIAAEYVKEQHPVAD
ncbi:MAG: hypothetical protein WA637_15275 [Terriglobales bacterium]